MPSLADAMKTLTAQYYNALTGGLGLNPQQFQITQGQIALGATSQSLWGYLDTIPPVSIANTWTPGGGTYFGHAARPGPAGSESLRRRALSETPIRWARAIALTSPRTRSAQLILRPIA